MTSALSIQEQEDYDRDLALALQLQQEFDKEYENSQGHANPRQNNANENWQQIKSDEEYAKRLETMINGSDNRSKFYVAQPDGRYKDKLYSSHSDFDEEDLETFRQQEMIEQSYQLALQADSFEQDAWKTGRIDRKNYNADKDQKDKFSLLDHMKFEFPSTDFHPNTVETFSSLERIQERTKVRRKDKSHISTQENVLDYRTRLILFRMINNPLMELESLNGCVSTGKEANLYHGVGKEGNNLAVKVFKTTVLEFKDRDRYVNGEFRFRRGYLKRNSKKMVEKWALKEYSNALKLYNAGIPCPKPMNLQKHVYVMEFIGKNGWPARRLHEANISLRKQIPLYREIAKIMRNIYHKARLIHADLSEFNILYYGSKPYIIDVSQSVSFDHPNAMEFLKSDCDNITKFFLNLGVDGILTVKELFDFVVSQTIPDESVDIYLDVALQNAKHHHPHDYQQEIDMAVFKQAYIPRYLHQVQNFEEHYESVQVGAENTDLLFYRVVCGLSNDLKGPAQVPDYLKVNQSSESQESVSDFESGYSTQIASDEVVPEGEMTTEEVAIEDEEEEEGEGYPLEIEEGNDAGSEEDVDENQKEQFEAFSQDLGKMLQNMEKRERKEYVKAMNRTKRETKMPKAEKKSLVQNSSRRRR